MLIRRWAWLWLCLLLISGATPTTIAQSEPIPPADPPAIAQRFHGELDAVSVVPRTWAIGAERDFTVINASTRTTSVVTAQLVQQTPHAHLWLDSHSRSQRERLLASAATLNAIIPRTYALWNVTPRPGIDRDPRLHLLFTDAIGSALLGTFDPHSLYPRELFPRSNEAELVLLHTDALSLPPDDIAALVAHELQHLIRQQSTPVVDAWLDEGYSLWTEHTLLGRNHTRVAGAFLRQPQTALTDWGSARDTSRHYGASWLFVSYYRERYGMAAVKALDLTPKVYADWALATGLQQGDYRYGTLPPAKSHSLTTLPHTSTGMLPPYSTNYWSLDDDPLPPQMTLSLTLPEYAPLIVDSANRADDPPSGAWFWYSQRGDRRNPSLTRSFDLRGVPSATLHYDVWFNLEESWDYAYISVRPHGSQRWQLQATTLTTDENPNGEAYGTGYTGSSDGWQRDTLVLDAFAGQQIDVRVEVVTDSAVNEAGLALDNLHLDAIGYADDLEAAGGGWHARGFLRTQNRTPQQGWLQVAQVDAAGAVHLSRWQVNAGGTWQLDLLPHATRTLIALSPYATTSTAPVPYTLTLMP